MHFENNLSLVLLCLFTSIMYADDTSFEKLYVHAAKKICAYSKMENDVCKQVAEHFKPAIQETNKRPVLDEKTVDVLELLESNNSNEDALVNKIPCLTEAGQLYAGMKLAFPHSTAEDINKSQEIVQGLVENPEVLGQIRTALTKLHRTERKLMEFYTKHEQHNYLTASKFSESTYPITQNLHHYFKPTQLVLGGALLKVGGVSLLQEAMATSAQSISNGKFTLSIDGSRFITTVYEGIYSLIKIPSFKMPMSTGDDIVSNVFAGYETIGKSMIMGYIWYHIHKRNQEVNPLHEKIQLLHEYIHAGEELEKIIKDHSFLANNISHYPILKNFNTMLTEDGKRLYEIIKTNSFAQYTDPSWNPNKGRIIASYLLLHKTKDEMLPFIQALSELDAYAAAAVWYQSRNYLQGPGYSFGQTEVSAKPQIKADQSWNMHMDPDSVVVNDIVLGNKEPNNAVISGINADGKTKIMESLMLNAIIEQSFGFSAAKEFTYTPFSAIRIHANVTDDVTKKLSKYQAELDRAKEIKDTVQSLKPHEKALVFFDEAFATTNPKAGSTVTCEYAESLAKYSNVIAMYVSFHHKLARMAENNPTLFKNYHVVAHEQPDGSFKRTYKLAQGYSKQIDALQLARIAGVIE
ncbi:MAG TPA: hypothetical protein VGW78_05430 [Candidatus Babeliales bacterium]|nr:hypothetical protein [Candidatus Babeliales bacterium]